MKINEFGIKLSDKIAQVGGSWSFIIVFTICLLIWISYNLVSKHAFDVYPFILLNLVFSALAAYQAPIILMAANRQATKDRESLEEDLVLTKEDLRLTKEINARLMNIEQILERK